MTVSPTSFFEEIIELVHIDAEMSDKEKNLKKCLTHLRKSGKLIELSQMSEKQKLRQQEKNKKSC